MHNEHGISASLSIMPGWDKMSAYERTKLACAELMRAGASIPAWTTIRDIIGKGSANDINRAKKDFRLEHAETLRKLEGFSAEGIPETLTPHIQGLWQEAISHVQRSFAEKERVLEEDVEQAVAAQLHAQAELERTQAAMQALQAKAEGIEQARLALQDQVRSEQAARSQAEKMMGDIRADLVGQRDRLDEALAHAQAELEKAINRLEATERRSMMEIERARQEAAQKVANANAMLKGEQEKHSLETTRLSKQIQDGRISATRIQERNAVLEQENRTLTDRAKRAETLADELQIQNTRLLATIGKPNLRRNRAAKKKGLLRKKIGRAVQMGKEQS